MTYQITNRIAVWHGEGKTLFYVVKSIEGGGWDVVATFTDRRIARRYVAEATDHKCDHEYFLNTACGVKVCNKCDDHKGLVRCFCAWSADGGDGRRQLIEMGENVEEDY